MCSCVSQGPLLSHDLVGEVSQRALACITWKSHHEPCGLCQQTINGQRTRLIEVLEGLLEMGAGKHWCKSGHAEVICVDTRWGVDSGETVHGQICRNYPCENAPGWDGEKQLTATEMNQQ